METKNKNRILSISLSIIFSVFLVCLTVYGATTIGTNVNTGGTLTVTGISSLATASTTGNFWLGNYNSGDDDYLYMDSSSSEWLMWDDSEAEFAISDDLAIGGHASTTGNFWLGNYNSGDDDYLYMDGSSSEWLSWDNDPGEFDLSDDLTISGSATTTGTFSIGEGTAVTKFGFGTCHFAQRTSFAASTTEHIWCIVDGQTDSVTTTDYVFVTATSSFGVNFAIQAASSTVTNGEEGNDRISLRVAHIGVHPTENTTLQGTTLNWIAIR